MPIFHKPKTLPIKIGMLYQLSYETIKKELYDKIKTTLQYQYSINPRPSR